tara:strand:+ start:532 stop:900 length:369 start_codon:yes stop_codon:yes gene_type:complete
MKKLLFLLLLPFLVHSQDMLTTDNFKTKIAKDIVVVEFWASWNAVNQFNDLPKLKDCKVYRVDVSTYIDIQIDYSVEAIPTIVIFDNGEEKERFKPNIMFQLEANKKTIQHSVDTLLLNKFN